MPFKGALKKGFNALMPPAAQRLRDRRADDKKYPPAEIRPLTADETALIQGIFGKEVNTGRVRHYFSAAAKPSRRKGYVVAATTFGKKRIKFYSDVYDSKDYSQTLNLYNFGTFVHEMAHVWQNQHSLRRALHKKRHPTTVYAYELTEKSRFSQFGEEQQASMIEDYARQLLYKHGVPRVVASDEYMPSFAGIDPTIMRSLPLLMKVVEDRFPAARKTRLNAAAPRPGAA